MSKYKFIVNLFCVLILIILFFACKKKNMTDSIFRGTTPYKRASLNGQYLDSLPNYIFSKTIDDTLIWIAANIDTNGNVKSVEVDSSKSESIDSLIQENMHKIKFTPSIIYTENGPLKKDGIIYVEINIKKKSR